MRLLFSLCSQTSLEMRDQNEGEVGKSEVRETLALPFSSSGGVPCPGAGLLVAPEAAEAETAGLGRAASGEIFDLRVMGHLASSSVERA